MPKTIKTDILKFNNSKTALGTHITVTRNFITAQPDLCDTTLFIDLNGGCIAIQYVKKNFFYVRLFKETIAEYDWDCYFDYDEYIASKIALEKINGFINDSSYFGFDYNIVLDALRNTHK